MIWIVHELEWVLLYFLNVKHYFLKNEQVEKEEKSSNNSRKIKGKRINKLNVRFWKQYEKNTVFALKQDSSVLTLL